MQSSVIDEILKVEEKASSIVEEAEKRARDMIFEAQTASKGLVKAELDKLKAESEEEVRKEEELLQENLREYEQKRMELENSDISLDEKSIDRAAERIVNLLLSSEV